MYAFPAFVRAYWRELEFGVNTLLPGSVVTPLLTAKDTAYRADGLSFTSPFAASGPYGLSIPGWMDARRAFLQGQLASVAATFAVTSPTNFTTNRNVILVTGTAPVGVKTITVNGLAWPITWTSVTAWRLQIPLASGANVIALAGLDRAGNALSSASRTLTVNYTGAEELPEEVVVFTEIMHHPRVPDAAYVELFNRSASHTFNLTGWRLNGLDYTFPPGALLGPRSYLVLAEDRAAFVQAYGTTPPLFDVFGGRLDPDGETLTLFRPGPAPDSEVVVDRVRYEPRAPWPARADGSGPALQLIDPDQDNSRVSNWSDGSGWRFLSLTADTRNTAASNFVFYLQDGTNADVYIDDVRLVAGTVAGVGVNLVLNGDFETGTLAPWLANRLATNSAVVSNVAHSGQYALHLVFNPGGPTVTDFYQPIYPPLTASNLYTLSFWYLPGTRGTNLNARVSAIFRTNVNASAAAAYSPAALNTVAGPLPPFPPLWLNEVQPENGSGPAPWIELFNAGTEPLSLVGCFLANNYAHLAQWAFPADAHLGPGEFLVVWADGRPELSVPGQLHTSFTLAGGSGAVALSRQAGETLQLLDYLNYDDLAPDWSYGAVPDGQPFYRRSMFHVTPGGPNNGAAPPLRVFINEWMASNTGFLRNPVDGATDDWFELYNAGAEPADLGGHYLTDDLFEPFKSRVPANGHYVIPPGGYLLVWANGKAGYNHTNRPDLFVNFQLSREGEAIGLFAPDGTVIDAVRFGYQTNNVSQGRWPEGGTNLVFMPAPTPRAANVGPDEPPLWLGKLAFTTEGQVVISWSAQPGRTYRVQYKDNLADAEWTNLDGDVEAHDTVASKTDAQAAAMPQRFYRVLRLP
jgi:hypothetical protein